MVMALYRGGQFYWWGRQEYPEKPKTFNKGLYVQNNIQYIVSM
jgi:hypothetical protein